MPSTTQKSNQPAHVIRIGTIKAVVWANETKGGRTVHNVNLVRIYRDDAGEWHETNGLGRDDLLVAAKVLDQAHTWIHDQPRQESDSD